MSYVNKFVAVVKSNNEILRENDNCVVIPFGNEYSILLKNLNTKKAIINIDIDGNDALDGSSIIINPNTTFELKGCITDRRVKNKFKFIEKTTCIKNHRGDKIDDGIIRIEFAFEKNKPFIQNIYNDMHNNMHNNIYDTYFYFNNRFSNKLENIQTTFSSFDSSIRGLKNNKENTEEGITVKGSEVDQKFIASTTGELEAPEVIIIKLKGKNDKGNVINPITVSTKLICETCGKTSKSTAKYCPECGTFLR